MADAARRTEQAIVEASLIERVIKLDPKPEDHENKPMMQTFKTISMLLFMGMCLPSARGESRQPAGPIKVEVVQTEGSWQLLRDDEPYFVKGVGGTENLELLATLGANSVRTWGVGDQTLAVLDRAHELGLTVTVGIWMEARSQGGDYTNEELKRKQLERIRTWVPKLKDHPALLIWGIGNESEVRNNTPEYWTHLNALATLCKELDPNHPTMHVTAEAGGDAGYGERLRTLAPAIDIWGINTYGGIFTLRQRLETQGWDGPYLICEFGARGTWEAPKTEWGHPFEQTSTQKAAMFARAFREQIDDNPLLLGAYAFHWVQRPNPSHTWFSLMRPDGAPLEIVDCLQRQWTGRWPDNLGPKIERLETPIDASVVAPDAEFTATIHAYDPEGRPLTYRWMLRLDRNHRAWPEGGPMTDADMDALVLESQDNTVRFRTPPVEDAYRLLVFVTDDSGKVATANTPFFVAAGGVLPQDKRAAPPRSPAAPTTRDDYVE